MTKSLRYAALVLATAACGRTTATTLDAGSAPEAAAPTASVAAKPKEITYRVSFANFKGDELDECDDFILGVMAPSDAGADWAPPEDPTTKLRSALPKTATVLTQGCQKQFADRQALAACTHDPADERDRGDGYTDIDGGKGSRAFVMAVASFYSFDTVINSDEQMRLCLQEHGKWTAIPRDSEKYRHAKREHDLRLIQKQLKR